MYGRKDRGRASKRPRIERSFEEEPDSVSQKSNGRKSNSEQSGKRAQKEQDSHSDQDTDTDQDSDTEQDTVNDQDSDDDIFIAKETESKITLTELEENLMELGKLHMAKDEELIAIHKGKFLPDLEGILKDHAGCKVTNKGEEKRTAGTTEISVRRYDCSKCLEAKSKNKSLKTTSYRIRYQNNSKKDKLKLAVISGFNLKHKHWQLLFFLY